jgi:hypothetical protein
VTAIVRGIFSVLIAALGGMICYLGGWILLIDIVPKVMETGLSLTGDHMILNRNWKGNQLYVLVVLYELLGFALVFVAVRIWPTRKKRAA